MPPTSVRCAAVAALLLQLVTAQRQQLAPGSPLKGYVYFTYDEAYLKPTSAASLAALRATGAAWVEIGATYYVENVVNSTAIFAVPGKTPTDAAVLKAIADARALGFKVALKPHIDSLDGIWRAHIGLQFHTPAQWAAWWANYSAFIDHFAQLAVQAGGVDLFNCATELDGTWSQEPAWRNIIAGVRAILPGTPLTVGANWGPVTGTVQPPWVVQFWDALDFIGVDAYYPLAPWSNPSPGVPALEAAWAPITANLSALSQRWNRSILFPEIGYASFAGAAVSPAACCSGMPALQLQADLFTAFFNTVWRAPWFAGAFWWDWQVADINTTQCNTGFSIYQKPAEAVVRQYYGGAAPAARALPRPASASAGSQAIYSNGTTSWDTTWSWGATVNWADSANPYPGHAASATATMSTGGGALVLHRAGGQSADGFTSLSFDLILANVTQSLALSVFLCACDDCNTCAPLPSLPLADLLPANDACALAQSWTAPAAHFTVPLARLLAPTDGSAPVANFTRLQLGGGWGMGAPVTFRVDNVALE